MYFQAKLELPNTADQSHIMKMNKVIEQPSNDKNKKRSISAFQGELPLVYAKEQSGRASCEQDAEIVELPAGKHNFRTYKSVEEMLKAEPLGERSLFLGNGFNIAIGVNTSYGSLNRSLLKHATINKLFEHLGAEFYDRIKHHPAETEELIDSIEDPFYSAFVKEVFYNRILQRVKRRYNYREVVEFLQLFGLFFTTNYDPLLYLLLLSMTGAPLEKDEFYNRVKQIHDGWVQAPGDEARTPLEQLTKKQLHELLNRIIKEEEGFGKKKMEYIYRVLKDIRGEPIKELEDGFRMVRKGFDPEWVSLLTDEDKSNLFYLHGGTFFYRDGKIIRKQKSATRGSMKSLATPDGAMCVFAATSKRKMEQIEGNAYLEHCQEMLRNIRGCLCIVGWSCHKSDKHLIDCINENRNLARLFISCYGKNTTALNQEAEKYTRKFKDKDIIFWNVKESYFCKKGLGAAKR